jgi:general secretion pathway protein K
MNDGPINSRDRTRRGSALIVALWTVGLLAMFVGSFAFDAHVEARITSYYRKRTKADYLARSGVEIARMLMAKSEKVSEDVEPEKPDHWYEDAKRLKQGAPVRLEWPLGEGKVILEIASERARRNVNLLTREEDWERVLEVAGIPEEMWASLIDPVLDWMDPDPNPRPGNGAETDDYYSTLNPPMRAKNGPLDTVGELLLVKGFTPAILYGGQLNPQAPGEAPRVVSGIEDLLTVYGGAQANANAASDRVLRTLPGLDDVLAGALVEARAGREGKQTFFKDDRDLFDRFPELNTPDMQKLLTTRKESFYRITSIGEVHGVRKQVWCIAQFVGGRQPLRLLRWREQD